MSRRFGYLDDDGDALARDLSDEALEGLLSGRVPGDRPELARLAEAIGSLRRAGSAEVPDRLLASLAASAALEAGAAAPAFLPAAPRPHRLPARRWLPGLAARAAVGTGLFLVLGTGAAVAGILPDPVQRAFANVATVVGIDLPRPAPAPTTTTAPITTTTTEPGVTTTTAPATDTPVATTVVPSPTVVLALVADTAAVDEPGATVRFAVEVRNTTAGEVTVASLSHDDFGSLLTGRSSRVTENTCATMEEIVIAGGGTFSCAFSALLEGRGGGPDHTADVSVRVVDRSGHEATATASSRVVFTDVAPTVTISALPSATTIAEPGGVVTVEVTLANTSVERITLVSLADGLLGDLLDPANPQLVANSCPTLAGRLAVGAVFGCVFQVDLRGDAAAGSVTIAPTAVVGDRQSNTAAASAPFEIAVADVAPAITVAASTPRLVVAESGGAVEFAVTVSNASVEPVTLTGLGDAVFGDLLGAGNPAVSTSTCPAQARVIGVGGSLTCAFTAVVGPGNGDPDHTATITASAADNEGNSAHASSTVTVGFVPDGTIVEGMVFADFNSDGVQTGDEPGFPGVEVVVTAPGVGTTIATTRQDGTWSLLVPPGEVVVTVIESSLPPGLVPTAGNISRWVTAVAGTTVNVPAVGFWYSWQVLGGELWADLNGNGKRNGSEPTISGVTVRLVDEDGGVADTAVTGGSGRYSFTGNPGGAYTISIDSSTMPAGLAPWADPDGGHDGATAVVAGVNDEVTGLDFGYRGTGTISNGQGPPGATVRLVWAGFDGVLGTGDDYTFTTTADAAGRYSFAYLPQGSFSIAFE